MRRFFGIFGLGLVLAALSGAAVSWDGSVYLLHILDADTPFVPHDRYINVLLHIPVLALSNGIRSVAVLQTVLGLTYALLPLASLALCWWIVRQQKPALVVWAALGIGIGMLPGMFNMVAEAQIAVYLFWPVLFILLTGVQRRHVAVAVILMVALLISHPNASLLFGFGAVVAAVLGWREQVERRKMWFWAAALGIAALLAVLRLALRGQAYERDQLSTQIFGWTFSVAVWGLPFVALVLAAVAAVCLFVAPLLAERQTRLVRSLPTLATLAIAAAGISMVFWAMRPQDWAWANKYTLWAPIITLLFMGAAVLERLIGWSASQGDRWKQRQQPLQAIAVVALVTLAVQSTVWLGLTNRLRDTLSASQWNCVSMAPVEWIRRTPLAQFGTPALSLLVQGQQPTKVMLDNDECGTQDFEAGLALDQYVVRDWNDGWFDMHVLNERLLGEQTAAQQCSYALTSGWHQTESNGPYWWRWSDGADAQIRVLTPQNVDVALSGQIQSVAQPNDVDVFVNGEQQPNVEVTWDGLQDFRLTSLPLQAGDNTIRLVSRTPSAPVQGRMLAIGVANLVMTTNDPAVNCTWHP